MSFSYDPSTGTAYSSTTDFTQWSDEINLGREAWLDVWLQKLLPHSVYRAAHRDNKKSRAFALSYLRQNGYELQECPQELTTVLVKNGQPITGFRVALQPPDLHKCRFCGNPVEPSQRTDLCGNCDLENRLANKFKSAGWNASDVLSGQATMRNIKP